MVTRYRFVKFLALFMALALLLAACDRPFSNGDGDTPEENENGAVVVTPAEGGDTSGETPQEDGEETPAESGDSEPTPAIEEGEEPPPATAVPTVVESGGSTDAATPETPAESGEDDGDVGGGVPGDQPPAEDTPASEEPVPTVVAVTPEATTVAEGAGGQQPPAAVPSGQPLPATHTVAAGENLYRIGLRYGLSWVAIARFNNLSNAHRIYVGQVLRIPGGGSGEPGQGGQPVPTPTGVNYIVQYGDNLYRIGLRFGISWVEIAEANGLVNPNQIYAGQLLKIPVNDAPGPIPPPVVSHLVKSGETLYRISLQYGVHWMAIARANNIWPPYFIYAGQTLIIPAGN
jgi:LysM repeat protein